MVSVGTVIFDWRVSTDGTTQLVIGIQPCQDQKFFALLPGLSCSSLLSIFEGKKGTFELLKYKVHQTVAHAKDLRSRAVMAKHFWSVQNIFYSWMNSDTCINTRPNESSISLTRASNWSVDRKLPWHVVCAFDASLPRWIAAAWLCQHIILTGLSSRTRIEMNHLHLCP